MRPVIGYATRNTAATSPGTAARFSANQSYAQAIADHGGAPLMIPSLAQDDVLSRLYELLDGLLLPGGPDIDPTYYGEPVRHPTVEVDEALDATEVYLLRRALADDLPVLGICRGVQVLNVVGRGTLYQDLPSQLPDGVPHSVAEQGRHYTAHTITVERGTRLAGWLGADGGPEVPVNTLHHQAVRAVAPGFVVNARAEDGLVEGIEHPGHTFVAGVQCHPEELYPTARRWDGLFSAFVQAAARRMAGRGTGAQGDQAARPAVLAPR